MTSRQKITIKLFLPLIKPTIFLLFSIFGHIFLPRILHLIGVDLSIQHKLYITYTFETSYWLIGAWLLNRTWDAIFYNAILEHRSNIVVPVLIRNLNGALIFFIACICIISNVFDRSITGIITALSAIGLVIGLAFRNLLSDIIDGVSLSIDQPFKVGDFIRFRDISLTCDATVIETTWRSTRLLTDVAGVLIIPNSQLYKKTYTNYTTSGEAFFELNFQFDTLVPIEHTKQLLVSAAISTPGVNPHPVPEVAINRIENGNLHFELFFAYNPKNYKQRLIKDAVTSKVYQLVGYSNYSFGVEKQLHMVRKTRKSEEGTIPLNHQHFLKKVPLFKDLNQEEFDILLDGLKLLNFKENTKVIEIEDQLESLFVIQDGMLSVHIKPADKLIKVAYLTTGTFFGEMSLLTGSKASARIVTENPTALYQINKQTMRQLFEANPDLIKSISMTIAERQASNSKSTEEALSAEDQESATNSIADKLVRSISDFFKLD